jgi:hypothetical protein
MLRSKNIYMYIYQDVSNMLSNMQYNKKGQNTPPCRDWPDIDCAAQLDELVSLMDEFSQLWRSAHSSYFELSSVRKDDRIGRMSRCGCGCECECGCWCV